jgi:tRNA (cytidine/uridine-2'-O-)-methyltransferase
VHVVLFQPEIPWNTGNVGRTCVAAGATLHLIEPLGFSLSERRLKRAGLDYWPLLQLRRHESFDAFSAALPPSARVLAFAPRAQADYWDAPYGDETYLLFGRESSGLPADVVARCAGVYRIPVGEGIRSLNLSTSVAVAVYEGLRRRRATSA